jgi:hypothetical protein
MKRSWVSGMIQSFRVYEPLRRDPDLFQQVRLGEHGADVVWSHQIDLAADTLWRLSREQEGFTLPRLTRAPALATRGLEVL